MKSPMQTPFDSVENAQAYVRLLIEALADAKTEVEADVADSNRLHAERRVEALRLVQYKLDRLEKHLVAGGHLLNDLRRLRRLLLDEPADLGLAVTSSKP
ncbi:MAG: hypothetical protein ACRD23_18285 [Terriglobales bacterium]